MTVAICLVSCKFKELMFVMQNDKAYLSRVINVNNSFICSSNASFTEFLASAELDELVDFLMYSSMVKLFLIRIIYFYNLAIKECWV